MAITCPKETGTLFPGRGHPCFHPPHTVPSTVPTCRSIFLPMDRSCLPPSLAASLPLWVLAPRVQCPALAMPLKTLIASFVFLSPAQVDLFCDYSLLPTWLTLIYQSPTSLLVTVMYLHEDGNIPSRDGVTLYPLLGGWPLSPAKVYGNFTQHVHSVSPIHEISWSPD